MKKGCLIVGLFIGLFLISGVSAVQYKICDGVSCPAECTPANKCYIEDSLSVNVEFRTFGAGTGNAASLKINSDNVATSRGCFKGCSTYETVCVSSQTSHIGQTCSCNYGDECMYVPYYNYAGKTTGSANLVLGDNLIEMSSTGNSGLCCGTAPASVWTKITLASENYFTSDSSWGSVLSGSYAPHLSSPVTHTITVEEIMEETEPPDSEPETHTCSDPSQTIMKLFSSTNSHGALWNDESYEYDICYNEIFEEPYRLDERENPHECTGTNRILSLYDVTNAHASVEHSVDYAVDVCYGDLECRATTGECSIFPPMEYEVLRLFSNTNSHISSSGDLDYPIKICCSSLNEFSITNCNLDGDCDSDETPIGCPEDCTPFCGIGEEWCADGSCAGAPDYCGELNRRDCDPEGSAEVCDPSESCRCPDCAGEKDHCGDGLVCSQTGPTCELISNAYWSEVDSDNPTTSINIDEDGGSVRMNLVNTALTLEQEVIFKIYYKQIDEEHLLREDITAIVEDVEKVSAIWNIGLEEILGKENEEFYFKIEDETSNALEINILRECFALSFCSQYLDEQNCSRDPCGTAERSVESNNENIRCGETFNVDGKDYKYNCGCEWNVSARGGQGQCGPVYDRENIGYIEYFDESWSGSCFFSETTDDTCDDDDFLDYSWAGNWRDGTVLSNENVTDLSLSGTGRIGNFIPIESKWYYDPVVEEGVYESDQCSNSLGSRIVPCPAQIRLPFFGFWNLIASLIIIALIYFWWKYFRK